MSAHVSANRVPPEEQIERLRAVAGRYTSQGWHIVEFDPPHVELRKRRFLRRAKTITIAVDILGNTFPI
jgi:hypothetical protein